MSGNVTHNEVGDLVPDRYGCCSPIPFSDCSGHSSHMWSLSSLEPSTSYTRGGGRGRGRGQDSPSLRLSSSPKPVVGGRGSRNHSPDSLPGRGRGKRRGVTRYRGRGIGRFDSE